MSFTVLSFVILMMFTMITCIEIYRGIHRGFLLSLVSLGNLVVSLLLSFVLTPVFSNMIAEPILAMIKRLRGYQNFANALPSLNYVLSLVLQMAIGSILFLFVFFALRIVLSCLISLICKWCSRRVKNDPGYGREDNSCSTRINKIKGAICGVVSSVLLTMIVTSPIMGTLELSCNILSIVETSSNKATSSIGKGNIAAVNELYGDVLGNAFYRCGGRWIYTNASSTALYGQTVSLLSEVETINNMSDDALQVFSVLQNPQNVTQKQVQALKNLREELPNLKLGELLITDVIRECSTSWKNGQSFLALKRPAMNVLVEPTVMAVLEQCSYTNTRNAAQNADTILEIYGILLESGILNASSENYSEILSLVSETRLLEKLDEALGKNPEMKNITTSPLLMMTFVYYLDSFGFTESQYTVFLETVASWINDSGLTSESQKVTELSNQMSNFFSENGMYVPGNIMKEIASTLLNELPKKAVSAEDIKLVFEKYKNG